MGRKPKSAVLIVFSLALAMGAAGCKSEQAAKEPRSESGAKFFPTVKPSALDGELIFKSKCSPCHGTNGAGDGPMAAQLHDKPANFTDTKFMRAEEPQDLFEALTNGQGSMPEFKKRLTARQRWNVLFFSWSRATSPMQIAGGKNIYAKNCLPCHGKLGDGNGPKAAGNKINPPDFSDPEFMMKESGDKFFKVLTAGEKSMPSYKEKLTDDQRWSAIDYIWTFVYGPPVE